MESKLNVKAIEAYAETYANKLCDQLFAGKEKLHGRDILNLPVKQAGLFVLNTIYQSWAKEAENLKSPYFDYAAEEVQTGLRKLMNVLSQHILINRQHFEPLLKIAVQDTLLLVLSPYSYYKDLLLMGGVSETELREMQRFVKINGGVLHSILQKIDENNSLWDDPAQLLDEAFAAMTEMPQPNEEVLQQLAAVQPVSADDFYEGEEETPAPLVSGFAEEDDDEETEETATLNDRFVEHHYETIADKLKNSQPAHSLKSMLSINQKFMFINDLFDGSQEAFFKVLDFLETCETKDSAVSFIQNNYLKHNVWKANAPQVKEFMALLDRKFGV